MQKTEAHIREILGAINSGVNGAGPNADLFVDCGLTSVQAITLLAVLEEEFQIVIPDEDYIKCRTISNLTAMIDALLSHPVA